MILNDEEVFARLESPDNLVNLLRSDIKQSNVEIRPTHKGHHQPNIPPMVRALIADVSLESNEKQKDVAATFGISQPTLSREVSANEGRTAKELKKDKAHEFALDSLIASLNTVKKHIEEPGVLIPLKDAARLAKDMSSVVSNLEPKQDANQNVNNTKVILFAPNIHQESYYESVEV